MDGMVDGVFYDSSKFSINQRGRICLGGSHARTPNTDHQSPLRFFDGDNENIPDLIKNWDSLSVMIWAGKRD